MVMFSVSPPPKRKTDQRVTNVQFVTVTNLLLPKESAGIVLTGNVTVNDVNVFRAVDMKPSVVQVDAVVDFHSIKAHATALQNACAVIGRSQ